MGVSAIGRVTQRSLGFQLASFRGVRFRTACAVALA
jgi:hypothetical protein